jgi:kynurenine formamidase
MVANTGTYLDAPFHRYPDGDDLATMPLEGIVDLDGVLIDAVGHRSIDTDQLRAHRVARRAVLIRTGWSQNWGSDACYTGHPYLTSSAVGWLVEQRAALVGIDSLNIDATGTGKRPVHSRLLAARVPSSNTCAAWTTSLFKASASRPPLPRWLDSAPFRCGRSRSWTWTLEHRAATLIAITQDRSRAQLGSASLRWLIRLDYERAKG